MNRKKVFRQICERAMEMTQRAAGESKITGKVYCQYRSDSGPCLIGSIILDEHYNEDLESHGVTEECIVEALAKSKITTSNVEDLDFLYEIQCAHDEISDHLKPKYFQQELREKLKFVAKRHKVPFPAFYKKIDIAA